MKRFWMVLLAACGMAGGQDFSNLEFAKVATGYQFTEGPVWSHSGYLLFSDIPANKILRYTPGKGVEVFLENSNGANGNAFDSKGRLYSCEGRGRRVVRRDKSDKVEVLADKFEGKRLNEPNDIVVRKDGHIYFSDPAWGSAYQAREQDWGVYHITPKGEVQVIARPKGRPNGLAFSPDGKILYVDNSDEKNVRAYDLDREGNASNERVIVSGIEGVPDGMRVDVKGNLYVTAKAVEIYSPEGKPLGSVTLPETPANCAFGDADLQTLYVTARTSLYKIRMPVKGAVPY
jgi:gluconolactonase